jgi:hypothetical protein
MVVTHIFRRFIHTFLTVNKAFEQGFLSLSTGNGSGYYYYLYIDETRSLANHTALTTNLTCPSFGVSNYVTVMKDFQLKKKRAML